MEDLECYTKKPPDIRRAENKNTVVLEKDEAVLSFVSFFSTTKIEKNI